MTTWVVYWQWLHMKEVWGLNPKLGNNFFCCETLQTLTKNSWMQDPRYKHETSISMLFNFEEMSEDDDESDKHLEAHEIVDTRA